MEALVPQWTDYELIDTGSGKKLERFGDFTLIRPEPQAKWTPELPNEKWASADAEFIKRGRGQHGEWKIRKPMPDRWPMERHNLKFWVQPAPSGHMGVFPDQASHWDWIAGRVAAEVARRNKQVGGSVKVLSLFGHTGLASLAAAAAGAEVTHVDASRKAVTWARENQALSGLDDRPIRWIVEDALTFVQRKARRGNRYDAMVLDPPRFGRGPDRELWKLNDSLPELLQACSKLLSDSPVFVLLNVYTTVLTHGRVEKDAANLRSYLTNMLKHPTGSTSSAGTLACAFQAGELALEDQAHRRISASVFARAEFHQQVPRDAA